MFAPPRLYHIAGAVFRVASWVFLMGLVVGEVLGYRPSSDTALLCIAATSFGRMLGSLVYAVRRPPMWVSVATDALLAFGGLVFHRDFTQSALAISLGGSVVFPMIWLGARLPYVRPLSIVPVCGGFALWYVLWVVHSTPPALALVAAMVMWSWVVDLGIAWWALVHWRAEVDGQV